MSTNYRFRMSGEMREWGADDARGIVKIPDPRDDKYRHGVLGMATGSERYPGAAVLGVDAAYATGLGMVRFVGPERVADLVLTRRPETVLGDGRVDAWVLGSGTDWADVDNPHHREVVALTSGLPVVIDAGALPLSGLARGPVVMTPHDGELARLCGLSRDDILTRRDDAARMLADDHGAVVVLKGHETLIMGPTVSGSRAEYRVTAPTTWLATAGTGDVLGGILGALVATHSAAHGNSLDSGTLVQIAATACFLHGRAADLAGRGGPLGASDIAPRIAEAIVGIL